jgi:predicted lipoprotein with Yx(FWY)xxD motif
MARSSRKTLALLVVLIAAVAVAIPVSGVTAAKKKAPTLQLRKTTLGKVLVDSKGRTLYSFGADTKDTSRCSGACATNWPPAASPKKPTVGQNVSASSLKVIKRGDGSRQLSYAGHPLYRFVGDKKPGDVTGQGINAFGGLWYVLSGKGKVITGSAGSGSTSPGGYSSGGW